MTQLDPRWRRYLQLELGELFLADVKRINEGNIEDSGKVLCASSRIKLGRPRPKYCRSAIYGNVVCSRLPKLLSSRQNIVLFEAWKV
jgi:hypothetical protein